MDRMEMIHKLADQVVSVNPAHKVDLRDPQRTILIEVHKVGDHNS
jgi:adenylyl- and sulfurtransferase ThiI